MSEKTQVSQEGRLDVCWVGWTLETMEMAREYTGAGLFDAAERAIERLDSQSLKDVLYADLASQSRYFSKPVSLEESRRIAECIGDTTLRESVLAHLAEPLAETWDPVRRRWNVSAQ